MDLEQLKTIRDYHYICRFEPDIDNVTISWRYEFSI